MPHDGSLLQATVVFLLAVVLLVPLAQRLKLGAVPGYLLAGILIGPSVLGLLGNPDNVARLSEMGVVMLLFVIGLELSPRRLWTMRRALFGIGSLQVGLTATVLGLLAYWLFGQSKAAAIVLGLGLALGGFHVQHQSTATRIGCIQRTHAIDYDAVQPLPGLLRHPIAQCLGTIGENQFFDPVRQHCHDIGALTTHLERQKLAFAPGVTVLYPDALRRPPAVDQAVNRVEQHGHRSVARAQKHRPLTIGPSRNIEESIQFRHKIRVATSTIGFLYIHVIEIP